MGGGGIGEEGTVVFFEGGIETESWRIGFCGVSFMERESERGWFGIWDREGGREGGMGVWYMNGLPWCCCGVVWCALEVGVCSGQFVRSRITSN